MAETWPALSITLPVPPHTSSLPDLILALLDDFAPTAIDDQSTTWRVYFDAPAPRDAARGALEAQLGRAGIRVASLDVPDEDWAARSQAALGAIEVGALIVAPPWAVPTPLDSAASARPTVVIEPSMGFGTGHHASTRLCLRALQRLELRHRTVLDVGTGSGVLALAASRLGAARAIGVDVDRAALDSARRNLARNGCRNVALYRLDVRTASFALRPDIVLANLTGAFLIRHRQRFLTLVAPGGWLIASGLTVAEADSVRAAYDDGMDLCWSDHESDWVAFMWARRESLGFASTGTSTTGSSVL